MHTYLSSIYQSSFKLFKIRCIIQNKVNSPVVTINFSFKAFDCLTLIFVPIYTIYFCSILRAFTIYFKMKPCAMSAYIDS